MALYLSGNRLNVSSLIGFIALFGIALQNGVVLVGKINDLRKGGAELHEAVIQGAAYRFRPILMTEKDAVKYSAVSVTDAWWVPVEANLSSAAEAAVGERIRTMEAAVLKPSCAESE